ncbi:MAG: dihydrodipicolinate synthase family protein [Gemmataceae bacterium]|nr:dihydrodipicolinate synthase family protein [Gemmataceae bacterium]
MPNKLDPLQLLRPKRKIQGYSAILLPFLPGGEIDWEGFCQHVRRTQVAGLVPAINMDTGFGNLLDDAQRRQALRLARQTLGQGDFCAGAFVSSNPGEPFNLDGYRRACDLIHEFNGLPVIFQSFGLTQLPGLKLVDGYSQIARHAPRFFAFELGIQFAPFGAIYSLPQYEGLLAIPQCLGAKHSSLDRAQEWQRILLRDRVRPDFLVLTGNDLAIDMVMYGSDYLLGLSTFAPEAFALRDKYWERGDQRFFELNDLLQYLGFLAFRPPIPAYKHSAAQFLHLQGLISSDRTHPQSPARPDSDKPIFEDISHRLKLLLEKPQ